MDTIRSLKAYQVGVQTTSFRDVYLSRLQRLLRLRSEHEDDLNGQGLHLLNRSIFSAYCECRDAGFGDDARQVLHKAKFVLDQSANESGDALG